MYIRSVITSLLLLLGFTLVGQQGTTAPLVPSLEKLVEMPKSPEAAAFSKYGDVPVSYYNGTPNISIPLASLKGRSMEVPIAMTYDASGIRVEQLATWVGLGWNLNVGGMVSREVNGLPDDFVQASREYYPFYASGVNSAIGVLPMKEYFNYFSNNNVLSGSHSADKLKAYGVYIRDFEQSRLDVQPDSYSFSALGLSGKFYIDYNTDINSTTKLGVSIDNPELKIHVVLEDDTGAGLNEKFIKEIDIWDQYGTKYIFGVNNNASYRETSKIWDDGSENSKFRIYHSSWYLTKVVSANNRDIVVFNYTDAAEWTNEQYMGRGDVLNYIFTPSQDCPQSVPTETSTEFRVVQHELSTIYINGDKRAEFFTSTRDDLAGRKRLTEIKTFQPVSMALANQIRLDNDQYFVSSGGSTEFHKRLKLDGITMVGSNSADFNDPELRQEFTFTYDTTVGLPDRGSKSQDYWGYYNGASNTSLIPADASYPGNGTSYTPGFRKSDFNYMKAWSLTEVKYPTGGSTEYFYAANQLDPNSNLANGYPVDYEDVYGNVGLNGFVDATNPTNYLACDDATNDLPTMKKTSFNVPEDGNYNLKFNVENDEQGAMTDVVYAFFYRGIEKTYCQLITDINNNNLADILYHNYSNGNHSSTTVLNLNSRYTYHIMLVSNADIVSMKVSRDLTYTGISSIGGGSSGREIGGLRLYKVIDKLTSGTPAKTRYFYYGDFNEVPTSTVLSDYYFATSTASSAVLQQPLLYTQNAKNRNFDNSAGVYYFCNYINRYSANQYRSVAGVLGYSKVTEIIWDGTLNNGYTVHQFINEDRSTRHLTYFGASANGRLLKQSVYNSAGQIVQQVENEYEWTNSFSSIKGIEFETKENGFYNLVASNSDGSGSAAYVEMGVNGYGGNHYPDPCAGLSCLKSGPNTVYTKYNYYLVPGWLRLKSTTQKEYLTGGILTTTTLNRYESSNHYEVTSNQTTNSDGKVITNFNKYPGDLTGTAMSALVNEHRMAELISSKNTQGPNSELTLSEQNTIYTTYGGKYFPSAIQYAAQGNALETRIEYLKRDAYGNPVHLRKDGAIDVVIIWGYNHQFPVAQIQNATYAQIEALSSFGPNFSLGNGWLSSTQEPELRSNLPNALITTMEYKSGVGLSSKTSPNGLTMYYEYDDFGRLKYIKDRAGNILKKNEYAYKVNANATNN